MIWTIVLILALLYLIISFAAYFLQERVLFKPEKLPADFEFKYKNLDFDEYNLEVEEGVNINGIHFKVDEPRGVVFYLKGNSKSIKGWGKFAIDFTRFGYSVVMVDYRGFGKSTGFRTEDGIKRDLQFVYDRLKEQVDEKYILLYGRSLGSGFAAHLAAENNPRMLILDAPYYSMKHMAKRYLPFMAISFLLRFPIETYKHLPTINCPINIIHGTKDKLIPYATSVRLAKLNSAKTQLHTILGGGHNNLHTFERYHLVLEEILDFENDSENMLHSKLYSQSARKVAPELSSISFTRKKKKP